MSGQQVVTPAISAKDVDIDSGTEDELSTPRLLHVTYYQTSSGQVEEAKSIETPYTNVSTFLDSWKSNVKSEIVIEATPTRWDHQKTLDTVKARFHFARTTSRHANNATPIAHPQRS